MRVLKACGFFVGLWWDWVFDGSAWRPFYGLVLPGVVLIVGFIVVIGLIISQFMGAPPVVHLHGACQQFYQGYSTKYGMSYAPVKVCP